MNDEFAEVVATRGRRFAALATLPLNDPAASARELERAMTKLRLPGAMVFSNINGVALADSRFWPVYEKANELGAVLFIHPNHPVSVEAMTEYWLMPLVGFLMDTTLAAAHLVFAGVTERFPDIKWVLGHLGGAIPYLAERLDRGFHAFQGVPRSTSTRPPSEHLKRFYFDTVNFDPERAEAGHRLRRRRSHAGGQRLSAPDRQHPEDAFEPEVARHRRVGQGGHPRRQCGAAPRRGWRRRLTRDTSRGTAGRRWRSTAPHCPPGADR